MFIKTFVRVLILLSLFSTTTLTAHLHSNKDTSPGSETKLWKEPNNISSLDLYYGQGGFENRPKGSFKLVGKPNLKSGIPTLVVEDSTGKKWHVKLGKEAQAETAATRLLWAVGYYSDETYYLPAMKVEGLDKYQKDVMRGGAVVRGYVFRARLEPFDSSGKFVNWNWFENPFVGTREFNGLKVMMALINNWDLKKSNNKIYFDKESNENQYLVHDVGATFGKTGNVFKHSKSNLDDYAESKFIKDVSNRDVDFVMNTRPPLIAWFNFRYAREHSKIHKIVQDIPISDAKWIGSMLSKLSQQQLQDAFRAAGYKPDEVKMFADVLRTRINMLNRLNKE